MPRFGYYLVEPPFGGDTTFPETVGVGLLAMPASSRWGVYEFFGAATLHDRRSVESRAGVEPVSDALQALLDSGRDYPPALALARASLGHRTSASKQEFCEALGERIEHYLSAQATASYLLARSRCDCVMGGITRGQWVWLIDADLERERVWWISVDYCIDDDQVEMFDVTLEQVRSLVGPGRPGTAPRHSTASTRRSKRAE